LRTELHHNAGIGVRDPDIVLAIDLDAMALLQPADHGIRHRAHQVILAVEFEQLRLAGCCALQHPDIAA
jgi:hypothetical protein